jgi:SAM-dependent methyltransferase
VTQRRPPPTTPATALRGLDDPARHAVREHFDRIAAGRRRARQRYRTYYDDLYGFIRSQVPPGSRVLDLGCGDGELLASLRPSAGVGVDASFAALREARRRHPDLRFVCADVEQLPIEGPFDVVIASNLVGYLIDVQSLFRNLAAVVHPATRVIVVYYNFVWEPLLKLAERVGLKTPQPVQSWLRWRAKWPRGDVLRVRSWRGGSCRRIPLGYSGLGLVPFRRAGC